jgi:hypothetical protein
MRLASVALLIFGIIAVSAAAFADPIPIAGIGPERRLVSAGSLNSGPQMLSAQQGTNDITIVCCNSDNDPTDLTVKLSSLFNVGTEQPSDCTVAVLFNTVTFTCSASLVSGAKFVIIAPDGDNFVSAAWSGGSNPGPATPVPEPQSLILFASGLLSLQLGAYLRRRKLHIRLLPTKA